MLLFDGSDWRERLGFSEAGVFFGVFGCFSTDGSTIGIVAPRGFALAVGDPVAVPDADFCFGVRGGDGSEMCSPQSMLSRESTGSTVFSVLKDAPFLLVVILCGDGGGKTE